MLEKLKEKVCSANIELSRKGIVIYTWGNVSEIDAETKLVVIKPSGVPYETMTPDDMVVLDLEGSVIEGHYNPSSDAPTHLEIYRNFPEIKSITHTHSTYATSFAQSGTPVSAFGTTHADYFYGDVPVTRELSTDEVASDYELNTGKVIVETIKRLNINPMDIPAILVKSHGPFIFGKNAENCVHNAVVLEEIAKMNFLTLNLKAQTQSIPQYLLNKHYLRKHGKNAYYGQKTLQQ